MLKQKLLAYFGPQARVETLWMNASFTVGWSTPGWPTLIWNVGWEPTKEQPFRPWPALFSEDRIYEEQHVVTMGVSLLGFFCSYTSAVDKDETLC